MTEAVHAVERIADRMAQELGMDAAEFRFKNFIQPEQFPYESALGWEYDSGDYGAALQKAMDMIGYDELRREQAEKRERGELMGIGISSFVEIVGAGPSKHFDILGLKMFDSCEVRIHPTGKAIARFGTKSQGQGHETTYAQTLAEELGIPYTDIKIEEGDTDTAPYGLGTYASRSTPVAGAATAIAARKIVGDLLLVPSYLWDRKILVPKDHKLAKLGRKLTLHDLSEHPLVTYVFSFGGQSSLKKAFSNEGLEPDVVFTARDADVIKTYVRMGLGVGIVASMAEDCDDKKDLTAIEADGLFPRSTTWIGFRKDAVLRRYMLDFVALFAPHITADQLEQTRHARSQDDIDKLYIDASLPMRGGCSDEAPLTEMQAVGS